MARQTLKVAPVPNGSGEHVVLVHLGDSASNHNQFVTWRRDSDGNDFWGHYFSDVLAAAKDFQDRCNACGAVSLN